MTDFREGEPMDRARRRPWTYALWGGVAIGLAVVLYVIATLLIKHGGPADLSSLAKGGMKDLKVTPAGAPPPSLPRISYGPNLWPISGIIPLIRLLSFLSVTAQRHPRHV